MLLLRDVRIAVRDAVLHRVVGSDAMDGGQRLPLIDEVMIDVIASCPIRNGAKGPPTTFATRRGVGAEAAAGSGLR
jgi:hypothetical protein